MNRLTATPTRSAKTNAALAVDRQYARFLNGDVDTQAWETRMDKDPIIAASRDEAEAERMIEQEEQELIIKVDSINVPAAAPPNTAPAELARPHTIARDVVFHGRETVDLDNVYKMPQATLLAERHLHSVEHVLCAVYVIHNCAKAGCAINPTGGRGRRERETMNYHQPSLAHSPSPDYIVNTAYRRSAHLLRDFYPTAKAPSFLDIGRRIKDLLNPQQEDAEGADGVGAGAGVPTSSSPLDRIRTAALEGDDAGLQKVFDEECEDAVRRHRAKAIDALVGPLAPSPLLDHRNSLREVMPHVRFVGRTVPPTIPLDKNAATSSSGSVRTQQYTGEGYLAPEFLTYRPDLLPIRKEAFLAFILKVFDITLYETPLIDLPHDVWKIIEKFLQLLMPEPQEDRIPCKQNQEIAEWHLSRVRAVFAAFVDVYNVMLDKRSPDERLAFGADSTRIGVFIPDGIFYLKHPHGDAYAVMQSECKRVDQAAQKSISVDSPAQPSATSPSAPSSTTTLTPITKRKAKHPILGVVCDIKAMMSAQQKPYIKLSDLDIQRKEGTVYGKQICDIMLNSPPAHRTAMCHDSDASFLTFGFFLYRRIPKRKLGAPSARLHNQRLFARSDAVGYGLAFSPLVRNDHPELFLAILASIVPPDDLQQAFASSIDKDASRLLEKYLAELGYTLTPPPSRASNSGRGSGGGGDDKEGDEEDFGGSGPSGGGKTGPGRDQSTAGGSTGAASSSGGTVGAGQSAPQETMKHNLSGAAAGVSVVDETRERIPLHPLPSASPDKTPVDPPSPCSTRGTPPSSPHSATPDVSPDKLGYLGGELDCFLAQARSLSILGDDYHRVELSVSSAELARASAPSTPVKLDIANQFVFSEDFGVYAARSMSSPAEIVVKQARSTMGFGALRKEANILASLAAAGLAYIAPPFVGLFEGSCEPHRLALVTQRCGRSLDDGFGSLTVEQRTEIYDLLADLHKHGYYHDDFAARNVVFDGSTFRLIDYECAWTDHTCAGDKLCPELMDAQWQLGLRLLGDDEP
ncbi:hypothetical protein JCM10296v2_004633 [Rhodotorula toruloides]